ncbi:hypothetical protein D3C87_1960550 [compost metagenome]
MVELDLVDDDEDDEPPPVEAPRQEEESIFGDSELMLEDEDDDPDLYLAQRARECKGCLDMKRQPWRVECDVCGKRR